MTDEQFERIKKGLNFHSEGEVYNLCTLTETTLREIIEDAVKFYEKQQKIDALHIMKLQKQKGELTDKVKELEAKLENIRHYLDNEIPHELINEATTIIYKMV
jgi:molecular chaperone GrpE (heat shock protein)